MISVLHIDDEQDFLDLTRAFLEKGGDIRVEGVTSAEGALERLKESRYDAIVSDYQMAGMDGISLLKHLREGGDPIPFIILTGRGREQVAIEALNSGADFYLQKGVDPKVHFIELRNLVNQAVSRRQAVLALQESERKYRQLVELAREGIWAIDREGNTACVNPRMEEILGYAPGEMVGRHLFTFMDDRGREKAARYLERRHQGIKEQHEFEFLHKDGRLVATRLETSPILDESGNYCGALAVIADITGQKQAEAALRESEERLAEIINFLPDATFAIDRTGRVIAWNREIEELTGVTAREMIGKDHFEYAIPMYGERRPVLIDLILESPEEAMKYPYTKVQSEGGVLTAETISAKPRGRNLIFWARASLLFNNRGETIGAIESVRDITEMRRAEAALRESEERYRNLAEASQDLIYIIDRDDNIVYLNTRALELLGRRTEEVVGRPRALLFPPAADERMKRNLTTVFSDARPVRVENRIPLGDRDTWQDTTLIPLKDAEGMVTWVMGISRDITERKRIEDALRESEEKYRNLVERAHDGIIVIQEGVVKFCNRRTAEMWGGDSREIVGRPYQDFVDPAEFPRLRKNYELRMAGKEVPGRYDTRLMKRDGTSFPVDLNGGGIIYEGRLADLIVFRDNTERKMAEEALRNVNRKLNLLSSVTRHDMLNQLMAIVGYHELARSCDNLAEVKQLVDLAGRAAVTMRHQIEFTRQYQDVGVHSPEWQDLKDVIARASSGTGTRNVKVLLEIDPVRIFADPLLERVFSNLIENAFSHGEKVTTIRFSTQITGSGLTILCGDDGIGIPAHEKEKIFSPGYGRKTGYGLFLVREILGITGATIQEIGQEGKGALFEIAVPKDAYQVSE
jgi:PAS domain S-box-containing protein